MESDCHTNTCSSSSRSSRGSCYSPIIATAEWIPFPAAEEEGVDNHHPYFPLLAEATSSMASTKLSSVDVLPLPQREVATTTSIHNTSTSTKPSTDDDDDALESSSTTTRTTTEILRLLQLLQENPALICSTLETLKRIKRLRITLADPLRGVAAEYNRDAGNGTLAELVRRTELLARTCVDELLLLQGSYREFEKTLRSGTEDALAMFYVELHALMMNLDAPPPGNHCSIAAMLRNIKMQDAIRCCQEAAKMCVKRALV